MFRTVRDLCLFLQGTISRETYKELTTSVFMVHI